MPSHPCRHPTCTNYIPTAGYCAEHAHLAPADNRQRHQLYDKTRRDPEAKKFYDSAAWQRARETKLTDNPVCEICGRFAEHVHHKTPVRIATAEERTDQTLLQSLCASCHSRLEAETAGGGG